MIDAQAPLQAAVVAAVREGGLPLLGTPARIYDKAPANPASPYVTFGPMQSLDDSDDCHDGVEIFVELNAWSTKPGFQEVQQVAAYLARVLDQPLMVQGFEAVIHQIDGTNTTRDPDGLTNRARLTLRYVLAPTA